MYAIRGLTPKDLPRLVEINPNFTAYTTLEVQRVGSAPFNGWILHEIPLTAPFQKGHAYDFNWQERDNIRRRSEQDNTLIEVVEEQQARSLVGILDVEEESWRSAAWVWNIMLDYRVRGHGLGRRLMERAVEWSRARGLRAILLETQSNNTPACHFYAHMGFQLVGVNDVFYTNEDISRHEFALFWAYLL